MTTKGWTSGDTWAFEQLIIKANDYNLDAAMRRIKQERNDRYERLVKQVEEQKYYCSECGFYEIDTGAVCPTCGLIMVVK